jgi:hypothetical protein
LSDRLGRKRLIVAGMWTQAAALALVAAADTFAVWALAAVLLGAGTALVYPTLLAAIGDVAHPAWRARAVGAYRLWRDGGFAVGAAVRSTRRPVGRAGRRLDRRRPDRRLRHRRRRANVRDPAPPQVTRRKHTSAA